MEYYEKLLKEIPCFFCNIKYPSCIYCKSIILITKLNTIKSTISYKCETCNLEDEKNYNILNFFNRNIDLNRFNEFNIFKPINICKKHNKKITYFCLTCIRSNCDDCYEKKKYPEHNFYDLNDNKISDSKINNIKKEIEMEREFFTKKLNLKNIINFYNNSKEMKKYRNQFTADVLFNNINFLRILVINIKVKISIPDFKNYLLNNYLEYPNDYFSIKNVFIIDEIFNIKNENLIKKNENEIYEDIIKNSIKILKKYQRELLFEFMEINTLNYKFKYNIKNNNYKIHYYNNFSSNNIPFMYIEDSDLILYFDKEISCINIKIGEIVNYFKIPIDYSDKYSINITFLKNNKFLLYTDITVKIYEYKDNKINEIYSKDFEKANVNDHIDYIYMIFKENYFIIKLKYSEAKIYKKIFPNNYSYLCDLKDENNKNIFSSIIPINYLRRANEEYFFVNGFIIKISFNSENNIIYDIEKCPNANGFEFITDKKILFKYKDLNKDYYNKYAIYDLESKQFESFIDIRNNKSPFFVLKRIKNIYPDIKMKYLSISLPSGYSNIYPLKSHNEKNFIGKNSNKYEFKIFKYNIKEKLKFN